MSECYYCGIVLSSDEEHTDEPEPEYYVNACEKCCTVCNGGRFE